MTLHSPETFMENLPAGFDGLFEWENLRTGFFDGIGNDLGIMPTDIDAMVERYGRFLLFETKNLGNPMTTGQEITLNALHKLGVFTIIILHMSGAKNTKRIESISIKYPNDTEYKELDLSDMDYSKRLKYLITICNKWFLDANRNGWISISDVARARKC